MLRANLRLVVAVARRYRNHGVELLDLVQEGNLGLMKAIDKFDHRRGFRLATYAIWWIRVAVSRAVAEEPRTIRVPANMRGEMRRVARATTELTRTLGRTPGDEEIAHRAGISLERVRLVGDVPGEPLSLEMPVGFDESATLQDFLEDRHAASPAQSLDATDLAASVQSALAALTDREAKVVRMRFGIGGPNRPHPRGDRPAVRRDARAHSPDRGEGAGEAAASTRRRAAAPAPRSVTEPSMDRM